MVDHEPTTTSLQKQRMILEHRAGRAKEEEKQSKKKKKNRQEKTKNMATIQVHKQSGGTREEIAIASEAMAQPNGSTSSTL